MLEISSIFTAQDFRMKAFVFIILFLAVLYTLWVYSSEKEGFQATPVVNIPAPQPEVKALLGSGGPVAFTPPTTELLAPPPGQLASVNSFAYEDPSLEKAPTNRIQQVLENLKGFFANEANGLMTTSDPSTTLPLHTAKGDFQRLQDEMNVLRRNPGLAGTLTQQDINEVEANLSYLQRKWRLSANNLSVIEGFQTLLTSNAPLDSLVSTSNIYTSSSNYNSNFASNYNTSNTVATTKATLQQLKDASLRVSTEIVRLESSGTTDPVTVARVDNFKALKRSLDTMIDNMTTGIISEAPITKAELDNLLLPISNPNLPSTLPPAIQTLLSPVGGALDDKTTQDMMKTLLNNFLNGISINANLDFNYISPAQENIAKAAAGALTQMPMWPSDISVGASPYNNAGIDNTENSGYRGQFENTVQHTSTAQGQEWRPNEEGALPASTSPTGLDWKSRSEQICQQVEKRGYDPQDFGCLAPNATVSPNFSWRGYAKMVCTRLGTIYEPGVPEMCGCPPLTWSGWRG